jgi:hypothetical protein
MADPPRHSDADADADADGDSSTGYGRGPTSGTPRWVKVSAIVAAVLVLLVAVMLVSGGRHGPGRHQPSGGLGRPTPTAAARALR